ncbi:amino-acid N-acetyltransferase [Cerasicoccus fimbriatus]|uniref:amino-acid N-acetyltransferase n=1 Tax=Cerasicoccus fimbriatus TaxID=3014554 RepID=UPI0022B5651F|nr:amino-acid N-acetyltransferase [Cerasicoccus sp. TK19100]
MSDLPPPTTSLKPSDLRGILEYVPMFRGQIFVVAIDGSVVDDDNFGNVITDLAVLKSLHIRIVLVHGIGRQLKNLSAERNIPISDAYGSAPTDDATLKLATKASAEVGQNVVRQLTRHNLKCALTNAVRATEVGVIRGVNHLHTGKVDKIDFSLVRDLLDRDIVPVFSPICFDREGDPLRVNSDLMATELATGMQASKLIYLTPHEGLMIKGVTKVNVPLDELQKTLKKSPEDVDTRLISKAREACAALEAGVSRAHILDGRVFSGLLTEIFDKVGLGTMIHANAYQQIREARKKDAQAIYQILRNAANRTEAVVTRTRQDVENHIDDYFVYVVDESIIGCCALQPLKGSRPKAAELAGVLVQPFYQGKGVGRTLTEFAISEAKRQGYKKLIALSTQSARFFEVAGFVEGSPSDLPKVRREKYESTKRASIVLVKALD